MKKIFLGLIVILCVSTTTVYSQGQGVAPTTVVPAAPASQAKITFKEADNKHEFGTVPQGTPVSYVFSFTNTGKEPLVLSAVNASCGCTTPEWPKDAVAPGKSANIKVTYNAANPGDFTKTITVVSNAATPQTILTIHGVVKAAAQAQANASKPAAPVPVQATAAPKKN